MIRFLLTLLSASLVAGASLPVLAQQADEAAILSLIYSGKFEELKFLEARSANGDPVAMYWWGSLVGSCIYGTCERDKQMALARKSAAGGYTPAWFVALTGVKSLQALDQVAAEIGPPRTAEQKLFYRVVLRSHLIDEGVYRPTPVIAERYNSVQRELEGDTSMFYLSTDSKRGHDKALIRAMVDAGNSTAAESLPYIVMPAGQSNTEQLLPVVLAGDRLLGVALCITRGSSYPDSLLPLCEQAVRDGYPGALDGLIAHHLEAGHLQAARYFAELCELHYGAYCAGTMGAGLYNLPEKQRVGEWRRLADYYDSLGAVDSPIGLADRLGGATGVPLALKDRPIDFIRRIYAIRVRTTAQYRACMFSQYIAAEKRFELDGSCPWRKKVVVDLKYLGAKS